MFTLETIRNSFVSRWRRIRTQLTDVENRCWVVENRTRNQSELHVIDPNPSLTFSLIGIDYTCRTNRDCAGPDRARRNELRGVAASAHRHLGERQIEEVTALPKPPGYSRFIQIIR